MNHLTSLVLISVVIITFLLVTFILKYKSKAKEADNLIRLCGNMDKIITDIKKPLLRGRSGLGRQIILLREKYKHSNLNDLSVLDFDALEELESDLDLDILLSELAVSLVHYNLLPSSDISALVRYSPSVYEVTKLSDLRRPSLEKKIHCLHRIHDHLMLNQNAGEAEFRHIKNITEQGL
ncbi:hypothetical protein ACNJ8R_004110 [Cronobacter sakazakii]|nr:hypothetical protein [Cronobacter sakazakii]EJV9557802.1 hypothetical protein [Cronobacter sakazakii]EJV9561856.1 hypothetical protein [Cronobacter sakazakii]EJX1223050.1 hypothetical protein [Cronobacter sakazakii]EJX4594373.1 hypothetical protein [Cronobacter sakazakii]